MLEGVKCYCKKNQRNKEERGKQLGVSERLS